MKLFSELYYDLCDAINIVNATFTIHIVFVMINLLLTDVFVAFGTIREFLMQARKSRFLVLANSAWIALHYGIKTLVAYAGSSTTKEAEKTLILVTKLIGMTNSDKELKTDLNFLLIQMRSRNKNIRNNFFIINYKLILTVRSNNNFNCYELFKVMN